LIPSPQCMVGSRLHVTVRKLRSPRRERGETRMTEIKMPKRVSDMLKTTVENRHREKLGTIQDLMVGADGRVKYAILSHGGFLGIGDVLIPIPFEALKTVGDEATTVLDIDKQTLEKALNFDSKTWPNFSAAEWEEKIDRYFAAYAAGASQQ
jgi:sporulation protein YlmC with PRC-barrel domain